LPQLSEALSMSLHLSSLIDWLDIVAAMVLFAFPVLLAYLFD
jgi:hypothetical protein